MTDLDPIETKRRECLARYILALPSLTERRDFLAALLRRHGEKFVDDLKQRMLNNLNEGQRRRGMHEHERSTGQAGSR